ncbi:type ISP restriction/modification enzyme [Streptomyces peucetius]|uniref:DNA methyltransferase n=1 Tax=Streptomyces peucetius TaxID=1950 RepID=A0ABY6I5M8_STRPE|nr:type ISP restriction/modification enzyme [Streptomyces peucetius]UYQ61294.1 DNA methyltransferase [Streptomyces peucetius]
MRTVTALTEDVPLLDDLMPWSVAPLRLGRSWVMAPDAACLRTRWDTLVRAEDGEHEALFRPTRLRGPHSAVAQLPGRATGTGRLAREGGRCPEPVRVLHGPFDEQWLIPDHRLIDVARPELWRVRDEHQLFVVEAGTALVVSGLLPDGRTPAGRPGRVRPLYRRPGGHEPNLAPGLTELLGEQYGCTVGAEDVAAWVVAAAESTPTGCVVPLTADAGVWASGVALGRELIRVMLRGARGAERPRLPGGRRPYVRAALPARPSSVDYVPDEETLVIGDTGRVSPVPAAAWDYEVGGARVLQLWFEQRTGAAEPGTLDAVRPAAWPQQWTSELLELITVLAMLADLAPRRAALTAPGHARLPAAALRAAGVLPPPSRSRRPASVLDFAEEGPEGQFALL